MTEANTVRTALMELQPGHADLIEALDKLRCHGGSLAKLPQIVVVGNQSSGKSSVLEAISGIRFPVKEGFCTQFATQLKLRRAPFASLHVSVSTEINGVPVYQRQLSKSANLDNESIADTIEKAKMIMWPKISLYGVSDDILHIELSGPNLFPLTLVDLPGFYSSKITSQPEQGKTIVERLAHHFMSQKSSIILPVLSHDIGNSTLDVLDKAFSHDPEGHRTMVIFTKTDWLYGDHLSLARNEIPRFKTRLQWHSLAKHTVFERNLSDAERAAKEAAFFASSSWREFPQAYKGTKALRKRLSELLYDQLKERSHCHMNEIQAHIKTREAQLAKLGPARSDLKEKKQYLTTISETFQRLTYDGIRASYSDEFFDGTRSQTHGFMLPDGLEETRKFRTLVDDLNRVFYETMSAKGHSREFIDTDGSAINNYSASTPPPRPDSVKPWLHLYAAATPKPVPLQKFVKSIEEQIAAERPEDPGSVINTLIVKEFRVHSSRWKIIAANHIGVAMEIALNFVDRLLIHLGLDSHIYNNLMIEMVEPFFETRRVTLEAKLEELMQHLNSGTLQALEPRLRAHIEAELRKRKTDRVRKLCEKIRLLDSIDDEALSSVMEEVHVGCGHMLDGKGVVETMMAYYDRSLRTFTDNVVSLAIENCLISKIPLVLGPNMVNGLDDDKITKLVTEPTNVTEARNQLRKELASLQDGLKACRRHRIMKSLSGSSPPVAYRKIRIRVRLPAASNYQSSSPTAESITVSSPSEPTSASLGQQSQSSTESPPPEPATPSSKDKSKTPIFSPSSKPTTPSPGHRPRPLTATSPSGPVTSSAGSPFKSATLSPFPEPVTPSPGRQSQSDLNKERSEPIISSSGSQSPSSLDKTAFTFGKAPDKSEPLVSDDGGLEPLMKHQRLLSPQDGMIGVSSASLTETEKSTSAHSAKDSNTKPESVLMFSFKPDAFHCKASNPDHAGRWCFCLAPQ